MPPSWKDWCLVISPVLLFQKDWRTFLKTTRKASDKLPKIAKDFQQLPKISRRLSKIAEDFATTSEDNRRCRKIFDNFKTGPTISKGFPTNLEHYSEDVLFAEKKWNFYLIGFEQSLHSLLSVRREELVWMREMRSAAVTRA